MEVSQNFLIEVNSGPELFKRVVAGDALCAFHCDVETQDTVTVFVDFHSIVQNEFLPQDQTFTKQSHL